MGPEWVAAILGVPTAIVNIILIIQIARSKRDEKSSNEKGEVKSNKK